MTRLPTDVESCQAFIHPTGPPWRVCVGAEVIATVMHAPAGKDARTLAEAIRDGWNEGLPDDEAGLDRLIAGIVR